MDEYKRSLVRFNIEGNIYRWKVTTLWEVAKDCPIEEVLLCCFDEVLESDRWFQSYEKPSIANIVKHFKRFTEADLSFPIILSPEGHVLDGIHRIVKAKSFGHTSIKAVRLKKMPSSDFLNDDPFTSTGKPRL